MNCKKLSIKRGFEDIELYENGEYEMNFNEFKKVIRSKLNGDERFRIAYEDKKYIWIGTKNGLIGNASCHYEFLKDGEKIYTDVHFEDENNYKLFKHVGDSNFHIDWRYGAIRINKTGNDINSKTVIEDCLQNLCELDETYGEELERTIKKIRAKPYTDLLNHTHNLILHGAPGTGKTYLAHEIAEAMGCSDNEIGFVQFHPSYDYTDFVEGLRPVNDGGSGQIVFERKDGVFKKFCEKALKNLKDSEKTTEQISKEISIDEETEDFLSSAIDENIEFNIVTGNKFFVTDFNEKNIYISIPENEKVKELILQRLELSSLLNAEVNIENGTAVREFFKRKWRTQQDSYVFALYKEINQKLSPAEQISNVQRIEKKNFIFIIDEINRGEMSKIFGELFFSIDPGYRGKDGLIKTQYQNLITESNVFYNGFYVPENVYIIGTMNDIDRNVESMDFAFRRRFTFKEITAKDTQEQILSGLDYSIREEATKRMNSLNDAISNVGGLSSSYHIGGAYFLKLKDLDNDFGKLWEYHLEGLLREYLRGMENAESKLEDLKKAYNLENSASQQG